ncbi:hypothetical protein OCU04_005547 [Sclerotinia nivalis]|uniref:Uncharacterized protein n=1 Tax=Sclerotinia nivalis TaxID=352851 RepID=A0A9X0APD8_9HELO|nr:hypothetical protein OCU04_005547 [Sclerotinia nivalis]
MVKFLDQYHINNHNLPRHLKEALNKLNNELVSVTTNHFQVFISDTIFTRFIITRTPSPTLQPFQTNIKTTYAKTTTSAPNETEKPKDKSSITKDKNIRKNNEDNRLFIRLPSNHSMRDIYIYTIYINLKNQLEIYNTVLKEVQHTKSGFAFCFYKPDSINILESQI